MKRLSLIVDGFDDNHVMDTLSELMLVEVR